MFEHVHVTVPVHVHVHAYMYTQADSANATGELMSTRIDEGTRLGLSDEKGSGKRGMRGLLIVFPDSMVGLSCSLHVSVGLWRDIW